MRNLEQNMAAVQAGIWRGNYDVIQEAARAMAEHAKIPPREIERIRSGLGEKGLEGFVAADRYWHEKATELAEVAGDRNMDRIVDLTTELLQRCSSCHRDYRRPLRASPEW
jgi:cytochrome c556